MSSVGQPVPELPVVDVERAQKHYRDALGFEIGWLYPDTQIGAVSRGNALIFFRTSKPVRDLDGKPFYLAGQEAEAKSYV